MTNAPEPYSPEWELYWYNYARETLESRGLSHLAGLLDEHSLADPPSNYEHRVAAICVGRLRGCIEDPEYLARVRGWDRYVDWVIGLGYRQRFVLGIDSA